MKTALIVDDNEDFRVLIERYLTKKGWKVLSASNYVEALPLSKKCDVIILDYAIGDPDGETLLADIRKEENLVPVVMVSGVCPSQDKIDRFYDLGIFHFVHKPVRLEELYSSIDRATHVVELLETAEQMSGRLISVMSYG